MTAKFETFRHYCTVERNSPTRDAAGGEVANWGPLVASIPCRIEAVGGGELRRGRTMDATTTWLVTMRHPQSSFVITAMDRLILRGHKAHHVDTVNAVRAYDPDGKSEELFVECREYSNGG